MAGTPLEVRDRDPGDIARLLESFRPYLVAVAQAELPSGLGGKLGASDVVQDTIIKGLERFDQFAGTTREEFGGWLRAILESQLLQEARKYGRQRRDVSRECSIHPAADDSESRVAEFLSVVGSSPSQRAARTEQVLALADALAALPEGQRRAIELHHLQRCSLDETAAAMGKTAVAVAGLLHRGLKTLRSHLNPRPEV